MRLARQHWNGSLAASLVSTVPAQGQNGGRSANDGPDGKPLRRQAIWHEFKNDFQPMAGRFGAKGNEWITGNLSAKLETGSSQVYSFTIEFPGKIKVRSGGQSARCTPVDKTPTVKSEAPLADVVEVKK